MSLGWRSMDDAEREREYSPSSCLPDGDYRPYVVQYRRASEESWSSVERRADTTTSLVRYGEADSQTVDVVVPDGREDGCPLLVFIHGGYWQQLSKLDSLFAAQACVDNGWGFAAIDYTLAPAATLDEIVGECRRAVRTLSARSSALDVDPARLLLAGSSAGAHLAAMVAMEPGVTHSRVAGVVLVSGIFDLEPLIGTSVNDAVGLDHRTAERNSPLHLDPHGFPPALLAFGSNETSQFKAQSTAFAGHIDAVGTPVETLEISGRNHFDVILDLATRGTPLGDAVARRMQSIGG